MAASLCDGVRFFLLVPEQASATSGMQSRCDTTTPRCPGKRGCDKIIMLKGRQTTKKCSSATTARNTRNFTLARSLSGVQVQWHRLERRGERKKEQRSKKEGAREEGERNEERSIGVPELWFGSVRYDSAAIGSIRYSNGSTRFSVVTLLKQPCLHAAC